MLLLVLTIFSWMSVKPFKQPRDKNEVGYAVNRFGFIANLFISVIKWSSNPETGSGDSKVHKTKVLSYQVQSLG